MEKVVLRGQTETARILLENGFNLGSRAAGYLSDAALKGQKNMVELLLDHGAKVFSRNRTGGTPLHDAALAGQTAVIELLLRRGAPINARDNETGATPLMVAASMGRADAVKLLLKHGANGDLRDNAGKRALERAREAGDEEVAKLIQEHSNTTVKRGAQFDKHTPM